MMIDDIGFWKPDKPDNGWIMMRETVDGYSFYSGRVMVIMSGQREDSKRWLHVSFSRPNRMPDYDDITMVKRAFIGDDVKAIMIFPERKYYVNLHPYCLHLWSCLDGDGLPEFSHGLGTI